MLKSVFYYCICAGPHCCCSFKITGIKKYHLCVICQHFIGRFLRGQDHVTFWDLILTVPHKKWFFIRLVPLPGTIPDAALLRPIQSRLFTVLYFSVRSQRSSNFVLRAAILHECQNHLGDGGGLGGSEKNRGTVITSPQLAFRRHDRNFTPFTIH